MVAGQDRRNVNYGYVYLPVISGGSSSSSSSSSSSIPAPIVTSPPPSPITPDPVVPPASPKPPTLPDSVSPKPQVKPPLSKMLPLKERQARDAAMTIGFTLPKKLLDTGAEAVPLWLRDKITARVQIKAQK